MLGSSPTCGLSLPPAMLNPRPELPCPQNGAPLYIYVMGSSIIIANGIIFKHPSDRQCVQNIREEETLEIFNFKTTHRDDTTLKKYTLHILLF